MQGAGTTVPTQDAYRWWVLAVVLAANLGFGSTATILGASLAEVADDLGTTESALSWTVTAPFVALGVATPVFGKLGDLHGYRRYFLAGTGVFAVATLLSAVAPGAAALVALRAVAGLGASAALPNGLAAILHEFSERERPRAMGWFAMVATGGPAIGLVTGGIIIDAVGWRVIFVIYGLVATLGVVAAAVVLRPTGGRRKEVIDVWGAVTLGGASLGLMVGLRVVEQGGPGDRAAWALFALAGLAAVAFVRIERSVPDPLIPPRYFALRNVSGPLVAVTTINGAYLGGLIVTPILLQDVFGFSLSATASMLLLRPATFSVSSPVGGLLASRIGERRAALTGASCMVASMVVFVAGSAAEVLGLALLGLVASGAAQGLSVPALNSAVANAVDDADLGVASGMVNTAGNLGGVIGLQLFLLALGTADPHEPADLVASYLVGLGAGVCALTGAAVMTGRDRPRRELTTG